MCNGTHTLAVHVIGNRKGSKRLSNLLLPAEELVTSDDDDSEIEVLFGTRSLRSNIINPYTVPREIAGCCIVLVVVGKYDEVLLDRFRIGVAFDAKKFTFLAKWVSSDPDKSFVLVNLPVAWIQAHGRGLVARGAVDDDTMQQFRASCGPSGEMWLSLICDYDEELQAAVLDTANAKTLGPHLPDKTKMQAWVTNPMYKLLPVEEDESTARENLELRVADLACDGGLAKRKDKTSSSTGPPALVNCGRGAAAGSPSSGHHSHTSGKNTLHSPCIKPHSIILINISLSLHI